MLRRCLILLMTLIVACQNSESDTSTIDGAADSDRDLIGLIKSLNETKWYPHFVTVMKENGVDVRVSNHADFAGVKAMIILLNDNFELDALVKNANIQVIEFSIGYHLYESAGKRIFMVPAFDYHFNDGVEVKKPSDVLGRLVAHERVHGESTRRFNLLFPNAAVKIGFGGDALALIPQENFDWILENYLNFLMMTQENYRIDVIEFAYNSRQFYRASGSLLIIDANDPNLTQLRKLIAGERSK
jgi:hypothetical protein